jgi:UDP-N-acetylmuramate dehydrogenase
VTPERNVALAPHTSLRVGGAADYFVLARSADELANALRWAKAEGVAVRVVGGGSNLLVNDAGVDGLVVKVVSSSSRVEEKQGQAVLVADAGVTIANIARRLAKEGWGGLEWAANVPGTVGGAAVNNAGAFGGDTASCLLRAQVIDADGRLRWLEQRELQYAYRSSVLKKREKGEVAVVSVELRIRRTAASESDALVKKLNAERMRTQPRILSAGSVFANPEGNYAGKLIEEAGLKGRRVGAAEISEQHANFIVNPGGATAEHVYELMRLAQQSVFEQTGIWLKPEIELFGRWSDQQRAALLHQEALSHG